MAAIAFFEPVENLQNPDQIHQVQSIFKQALYRYLSSKMGQEYANSSMDYHLKAICDLRQSGEFINIWFWLDLLSILSVQNRF